METVQHVPDGFWKNLTTEAANGTGMSRGKRRDDFAWLGKPESQFRSSS
jgi:hypothetical protein